MAGTTNYFGISYPTATDYVKDGASAMQTIATGFDTAVAIPTYNNQTGTTYTFVLADAAKVVSSNNASGVTFTIPPQSSVTWAAGTTLTVTNLGAGTLTIAGGAGVTVTNSSSTVAQYGSASIIRTASDAWTVIPFAGGAALLSDSAVTGTTGSPTTGTYTSGGINYKFYSFTGTGSITLNKSGLIDVLAIAGGGGGGGNGRGGGGAGGYLSADNYYIASGTYTITVGAGGANNLQGNASSVASLFAIMGGPGFETLIGGSGGGGNSGNASYVGKGVTGQGKDGGGSSSTSNSGGGGGATAVGSAGSGTAGGAGGAGTSSSITGTPVTRAGGGGGYGSSTGGSGTNGGGNGGAGTASGTAGSANTGGGGGGGGNSPGIGGAGGSGIVIIRVRA